MGYYVEYALGRQKKKTSGSSFLRISMMTAAFFLMFCILAHRIWPRGQEIFQQLLFPGSSASTRQAAEVFVYELQNGEPIGDALENFCREIMRDADIP